MRRFLVVIAAILFFVGGVLALIWSGNFFITYIASTHRLNVEDPAPQLLPLGTPAVFDLQGSGFNRETSVSLVMDVDNSEAIIGTFPLEGIYHESIIHDDFLYLAPEEGGVQVLNVEDPQQPQFVKEYLIGRSINDIHRNGNTLYFCCGKLGVSIMQIQSDGLLEHMVDIPMGSIAMRSLVVDGFLYVAAGSGGLLIYDVLQPKQPEQVQMVKSGTFISRMAVADDYLYLAVSQTRIEIYHLADPQLPTFAGSMQIPETFFNLVSHRQQLYLGTQNGVLLYGLEDAKNPALLKQWTGFGSARRMFAGREYVYVSDSFSGLRIIDSQVEVPPGYVDLNIDPRTISETPHHLFIAGSNKGLLIVDKEVLSSRQVVRSINTPKSARDLLITVLSTKKRWM